MKWVYVGNKEHESESLQKSISLEKWPILANITLIPHAFPLLLSFLFSLRYYRWTLNIAKDDLELLVLLLLLPMF